MDAYLAIDGGTHTEVVSLTPPEKLRRAPELDL